MQDERLSATTLGVYCYIMSKSDNWQAHKREIVKHFSNAPKIVTTKNAVDKAFQELKLAGYIKIQPIKKVDESGAVSFCGSEYVFSDVDIFPRSEDLPSSEDFRGPEKVAYIQEERLINENKDLNNERLGASEDLDHEISGFKYKTYLKELSAVRGSNSYAGSFLLDAPNQPRKKEIEKLVNRYGVDHLKRGLSEMLEYFIDRRSKFARIKDFYRTLNNWLKKSFIDPEIEKYKDMFIASYNERNEMKYSFNDFDQGDDMKGLNKIKKDLESNLENLKIVFKKSDPVKIFEHILFYLPDFWHAHKIGTLAKNIGSIVADIKRGKKKPNNVEKTKGEARVQPENLGSWIYND